MKTFFFAISAFLGIATSISHAVPEKLELVDGRVLEKVTAAVMEDGKVKVTHSGGVGRIPLEDFAPSSMKALGIKAGDSLVLSAVSKPIITRLETVDGKIYEEIRSVRVKPSFISFVHRDGSASVRFDNLSEQIQRQCGYDKAVADQFDAERKTAEVAIAKQEAEIAELAKKLAENKELKKRREQVFWEMQFTDFGNNYWLSSPRARGLADAARMKALRDGGYSEAESSFYLNQAKYR